MSNYYMTQYAGAKFITPADGVPNPARGFFVGVSGNLGIVDGTGNAVTLAVIAGFIYPIEVREFSSTGTTATGIYGLV